MNFDSVNLLLKATKDVRWVSDGHAISLDAESMTGGPRVCLQCGQTRDHLVDDYQCLRCRILGGYSFSWDDIIPTARVICPFERMAAGDYDAMITNGQTDKLWVPPNCTTSVCGVAAEIDYVGAPDTCGYLDRRLSISEFELPLFTPAPIMYVLEIHGSHDFEYGWETDSVEFGWIPIPQENNDDQTPLWPAQHTHIS